MRANGGAILIVDDDADCSSRTEDWLREEGLQVTALKSPRDVFDFAVGDHPAMILVDVVTTNFNGFLLCRILKADPRTFHIPILLILGLGSQSDNALCMEVGANGSLTKPFDRAQLMKQVHLLAGARIAVRSGAASGVPPESSPKGSVF